MEPRDDGSKGVPDVPDSVDEWLRISRLFSKERHSGFVRGYPKLLKTFFETADVAERDKFYVALAKTLSHGEQVEQFLAGLLKRLSTKRVVSYAEEFRRVKKVAYEEADISVVVTTVPEIRTAPKYCLRRPRLVSWLERIPADAVFFDLGSWIGLAPLVALAGKSGGPTCVAFESSAYNYLGLCENLWLNDCADRVTPIQLALAPETGPVDFHHRVRERGRRENAVGRPVNRRGDPFDPAATQRLIGVSLDDAIRWFRLPFPTHVRIDVDGDEAAVLEGASETLSDSRLRCVRVAVWRPGSREKIERAFDGDWRLAEEVDGETDRPRRDPEPPYLLYERKRGVNRDDGRGEWSGRGGSGG